MVNDWGPTSTVVYFTMLSTAGGDGRRLGSSRPEIEGGAVTQLRKRGLRPECVTGEARSERHGHAHVVRRYSLRGSSGGPAVVGTQRNGRPGRRRGKRTRIPAHAVFVGRPAGLKMLSSFSTRLQQLETGTPDPERHLVPSGYSPCYLALPERPLWNQAGKVPRGRQLGDSETRQRIVRLGRFVVGNSGYFMRR
eukprot:scaffold340_cov256-Pinguiococcus_pyrenoidosus.AAC.21